MRKAWTMIELVFVIVIIGILTSIAIPKFAVTRNDAQIAKAKATLAAVRTALSTERQLRVLRGDFTAITSLNADGGAFSTFSADGQGVKRSVLEATVNSCNTKEEFCWSANNNQYTYVLPASIGTSPVFKLDSNKLVCDSGDCDKLQ